MTREPWWFRSANPWKRGAAFVALVVGFGVIFAIAGAACRLTDGYGAAQYHSSVWLDAHRGDLRSWRAAAGRDLFPFIAIYVVLGAIAFFCVSRRPWTAITLLVLAGASTSARRSGSGERSTA